jgi:predicted HicB family RNase H-like nuclease
MEYKGYVGAVQYDDDAKTFHGRIVGMRDMVTFAGDSAEALEQAFRDSVDDYLAFCAERGEEPEKPYSGKFVLRVEPTVHRAIAAAAAREHKSVNAWAADVLARASA